MKNLLYLFIFVFSIVTKAQSDEVFTTNPAIKKNVTLTYEVIKNAKKKSDIPYLYDKYVSESGDLFEVGGFIKINEPLGNSNFYQFINATDNFTVVNKVDIQAKGIEAEIVKLRTAGSRRDGYYVIAICKSPNALLRYNIQIEKAITNKEIHSSLSLREEAINELKEAKELFDLELMTREDYDKIKKRLAPIIMKK
jgi:hypothetical protein